MTEVNGFGFRSWSRFSWTAGGFGFEARDFGQQRRGFVFQRRFQRLVVGVGNLAGVVFEVQVAQVFVDDVFALAQVRGARFLRAQVELAGQIENIEQRRPR